MLCVCMYMCVHVSFYRYNIHPVHIFMYPLHFCPLEHSTPPDFPIFRTTPPADIFLTDGDVGVMACTVQYQNTSNAQEVVFENDEGILTFNFVWAGNDSIGVDFVPNSNLVLDTTTIITPYTDSTYTCRLQGGMESYTTTFHIIGKFDYTHKY